jgi:hypothetical protein
MWMFNVLWAHMLQKYRIMRFSAGPRNEVRPLNLIRYELFRFLLAKMFWLC